MEFFKKIGKALGEAAGFVGEKNRKAAYLNRIRTVIRCEERAAEREYLALGRYYYNNLRDGSNPVTEAHCAQLDEINARTDRALNQLEQFYQMDKAFQEESGSVAVIEGEDGPTAVFVKDGDAEEITLDDVESFDSDPMAEPTPAPATAPAPEAAKPLAPAEPGENDNLPFE